jgi:hypothetical protein
MSASIKTAEVLSWRKTTYTFLKTHDWYHARINNGAHHLFRNGSSGNSAQTLLEEDNSSASHQSQDNRDQVLPMNIFHVSVRPFRFVRFLHGLWPPKAVGERCTSFTKLWGTGRVTTVNYSYTLNYLIRVKLMHADRQEFVLPFSFCTNSGVRAAINILSTGYSRPQWSSGSVLATGPKVRGFKPGRGRWIFKGPMS